jgi:hypothetical protein
VEWLGAASDIAERKTADARQRQVFQDGPVCGPVHWMGVDRCFDLVVDPLRDADGRITGVTCATVDITERKHEEEALRKSQAFVQSIIDALSSHICVLDQSGTIIAENVAWKDFGRANRRKDEQESSSPSTPGVSNQGQLNYLAVCESVVGKDAGDAKRVAAGIRAILQDTIQHWTVLSSMYPSGSALL